MKLRLVLALGLALAACDDNPTIITHVDKLSHMTLDQLWTMQDSQGIPVEIHGTPFAGTTDRDLAEALEAPAAAHSVAFHPQAVGALHGGHGYRLVLHFNPQGAPNSYEDCRRVEEARTRAPAPEGFTVNATFCKGDQWQAHGYLQAPKQPPGDLAEYARVMRVLFSVMLNEEKDR